jgi:NAD(P)-dependent dehydrogenase (short-subunit alcohol dehydrogenase family)
MTRLLTRALSGIAAGLVATGAMSLVMLAGKRIGALGEPPPRRITRRSLAPLGPFAPRGRALDLAALGAHFGFGASLGLVYGLLPQRGRSPAAGLAFGLGAWAVNYAGWLPMVGLMPPPSRDRLLRPSTMIAAHLVFGKVLASTHRAWCRPVAPLRGKVALVCGGSRGLGRALAREMLAQGASVAICGREPGALEETRAWLASFGEGRVWAQVCDLRSELQTLELFERVRAELGPLDVVVANAATILVAPIETLTPYDFDNALRETFGTAARAALTALPEMRARRQGSIVFITSLGGKVGVPHLAPYSAAKFAEVGFAEALRAEVTKDGVHVLSVFPGLMRTGSHAHAAFRGQPARELSWFGAAAVTPLLSIDADRAARRVVRAIIDRESRLTLTPAAYLAGALHDLLPSTWELLSSIAGRLLPRASSGHALFEQREGSHLLARPASRLLRAIGERTAPLAERYGQ